MSSSHLILPISPCPVLPFLSFPSFLLSCYKNRGEAGSIYILDRPVEYFRNTIVYEQEEAIDITSLVYKTLSSDRKKTENKIQISGTPPIIGLGYSIYIYAIDSDTPPNSESIKKIHFLWILVRWPTRNESCPRDPRRVRNLYFDLGTKPMDCTTKPIGLYVLQNHRIVVSSTFGPGPIGFVWSRNSYQSSAKNHWSNPLPRSWGSQSVSFSYIQSFLEILKDSYLWLVSFAWYWHSKQSTIMHLCHETIGIDPYELMWKSTRACTAWSHSHRS